MPEIVRPAHDVRGQRLRVQIAGGSRLVVFSGHQNQAQLSIRVAELDGRCPALLTCLHQQRVTLAHLVLHRFRQSRQVGQRDSSQRRDHVVLWSTATGQRGQHPREGHQTCRPGASLHRPAPSGRVVAVVIEVEPGRYRSREVGRWGGGCASAGAVGGESNRKPRADLHGRRTCRPNRRFARTALRCESPRARARQSGGLRPSPSLLLPRAERSGRGSTPRSGQDGMPACLGKVRVVTRRPYRPRRMRW